jgi:hypothetical protein
VADDWYKPVACVAAGVAAGALAWLLGADPSTSVVLGTVVFAGFAIFSS